MASFQPSKKHYTEFNGGEKYRNNVDSPSATDFNNVVENLLILNEESEVLYDEIVPRITTAEASIKSLKSQVEKFPEVAQEVAKEVVQSEISETKKKVENLYARTFPEIDVIDSSVAYQRIVPIGALPYAEVAKVGGMSHAVDGSLVHAKVTEIKSIGKNRAVSTESSTSSERGIEITRNIGKSSAVLNGTATADSATRLFGNFKLPVGTYTASVLGLNSTDRLYVGKTADGGVVANYIQTNSPKTFTLTEETECFLQIVWGSGSIYKNAEIKAQIEHGNTATEYKPYTEASLPIPSAVQDLPDYGKTDTYIEWRDDGRYWVTPDGETDISRILPDDNFIRVEGGGTIVAVNEYGLAAPITINYQVD